MSPENPWCERPQWLYNHATGEKTLIQCGRSSRAQCAPCGERYRRRVRRVFMSGYSDDARDRLFFMTLTAPGTGTHCRRHRGCDGLSIGCDQCPCTPVGGVDLAEWNYEAGARWNRFIEDVRRLFGELEYAKAAEVQDRGALHFHAALRMLCTVDLVKVKRELRALAILHGFGHEFDVQRIEADDSRSLEDIAGYMAKYVSKTVDQRHEVPTLNKRGERVMGSPRCRAWTSSRRWGSTMKAVREAQRRWAENGGDPSGVPSAASAAAEGRPLDCNSESYEHMLWELIDRQRGT